MLRQSVTMLLALQGLIALLMISGCSDGGGNGPASAKPDYAPFGIQYQWTYRTTIERDSGAVVAYFETKYEPVETDSGTIWYLSMRRLNPTLGWERQFEVRNDDSAIVAKSREGYAPLFPHGCYKSSCAFENITSYGRTYNTFRITVPIKMNNSVGIVTLRLAPGTGLVKEESDNAASLFIPDYGGEQARLTTELIEFRTII